MSSVLILGAGRSSGYTISYLLDLENKGKLKVTVADAQMSNLKAVTIDFPQANTVLLNVLDEENRRKLIEKHSIVISLLPPKMHILIAQDCLAAGCHLITPSYISSEMQELNAEAESSGLLFLNEMGLDPGIDHMSAMKIIHELKSRGAVLKSFKSHCGGLIAQESDTNPWHYKFSWNPYNVIRAGQDGALSLQNTRLHYTPYARLFSEVEQIEIEETGRFQSYLNRDSNSYLSLYNIEGIDTFSRGTLRYEGFCTLWSFLVNAGLTSDKITLDHLEGKGLNDFFRIFFPPDVTNYQDAFQEITGIIPFTYHVEALKFIGMDSNDNLPLSKGTPAEILQQILEHKWVMQPEDKDRIVMLHDFIYELDDETCQLKSWLDITGENAHNTAMAKTVGLPLAIAAEQILDGPIQLRGVRLPVEPEIYEPILIELEKQNIVFNHKTVKLNVRA